MYAFIIRKSYILICDALRDMLSFVQFKNVKKTHGAVLLTLLHGCFSRFLNCKKCTQSRKTSHLISIAILI